MQWKDLEMGKVTTNLLDKKIKRMSQRKTTSTTTTTSSKVNLKRSKSVRASLRSISTRFLHHKNEELLTTTSTSNMHKSPSLSSLKENTGSSTRSTTFDFKRNYFATNFENLKKIDFHHLFDHHHHHHHQQQHKNNREMVETILKTPQDVATTHKKPHHLIMGFKRKDFHLSTPPTIVAPKAAAILQIPIKENGENMEINQENFNQNNNNMFNKFDEHEMYDHNFHRNTLRLSITSKARRTSLFHSTSMFHFILFYFISFSYLQAINLI